MFNYLAPRIANISLRSLAMGSKFALVVVLARLLDPAAVGLYGLFTATIGFSVLVIGGDYYVYSQRELLSSSKERWSFILQHQALANTLLYLILLPAQALVFWFDVIPSNLAGWFFVLLIIEHIAQEINRLLVAMQRQLLASTVLFIRVGIWVWFLLPFIWFNPVDRTLNTVFFAWMCGCMIAIALGGSIIWYEARPWKLWPIDINWLKNGFLVASMFLGATMCFRALQTIDRYAVEALAGKNFLGVYVLYMGMAMAIMSVLDPAVLSFLYPRLVAAYKQDIVKYRKIMRELAYSVTVVSLLLAILIGYLAPLVLHWIGKPIYIQYISILWLLLGMTVIYAIGMIPHYGLYAYGADKSIIFAHVSSLLVFGIVLLAVAKIAPMAATAYALNAAFLWVGLFKWWRYHVLSTTRYQDIM